MNPQDFAALAAQDYNRIPVSLEVLADLETPISAYRKLAEGPYSFFFESVQGGEKWGRYSIIGLPCRTVLKVHGYQADIYVDGQLQESHEVEDPLAFAEDFQHRYRTAPRDDLPVFHGGLVGYFGYDTVRYVEPRLAPGVPEDELGNPDILLMVSEEVLVFDNLAGTIRLVINADPRNTMPWRGRTSDCKRWLPNSPSQCRHCQRWCSVLPIVQTWSSRPIRTLPRSNTTKP